MSEAQTAALLGISVGTVKSQTSRALGTLRQRLAAEGVAPAVRRPAAPKQLSASPPIPTQRVADPPAPLPAVAVPTQPLPSLTEPLPAPAYPAVRLEGR
jgi:sigma-70-like protein